MAQNKSYTPGNYPQLTGSGGLQKYITAQLQQIAQSINGLNAQANTSPTTFANLPTPGSSTGNIRCITDSTVNTWGSTVAGGGTYTVLCWSNGTHWTVVGV